MSENTNKPAPFGLGMETSRRSFLFGLSAFALLPLARIEPETILYNGNIWTVNEEMPRAQAVAISGGRILAVGSNDEVLGLAAGLSRKVDLGGKTVVPGFNDAHAHPCESGVLHLRMVACDMDSIERIQAALRERAQRTPANQWVLGFLYDDGKTPRPLSRQDLDSAVPDHPVLVRHRGGHTIFVNSAALRLAGVDEKTPDPAGGRFEHDAAGHLTGHVGDRATERFVQCIHAHAGGLPQRGKIHFKALHQQRRDLGVRCGCSHAELARLSRCAGRGRLADACVCPYDAFGFGQHDCGGSAYWLWG